MILHSEDRCISVFFIVVILCCGIHDKRLFDSYSSMLWIASLLPLSCWRTQELAHFPRDCFKLFPVPDINKASFFRQMFPFAANVNMKYILIFICLIFLIKFPLFLKNLWHWMILLISTNIIFFKKKEEQKDKRAWTIWIPIL